MVSSLQENVTLPILTHQLNKDLMFVPVNLLENLTLERVVPNQLS
jgi:hypothetical protein